MTRASQIFRLATGAMLVGFFCLWAFDWPLPPVSGRALELRKGLIAAGYFFPTIAVVYLLVGLSYLTNRYVSLATIVLFPVTFNIVLYHVLLMPELLPVVLFILIPQTGMIYLCWDDYRALLRPTGHDQADAPGGKLQR